MNFSPKTAQSREKAFGFKHDPCPELSSTFYDQRGTTKDMRAYQVLTLTDGNLIHTGQRVNPLSHCAFIASLQAELRINSPLHLPLASTRATSTPSKGPNPTIADVHGSGGRAEDNITVGQAKDAEESMYIYRVNFWRMASAV